MRMKERKEVTGMRMKVMRSPMRGPQGSPRDNRPFILPENWSVNKFLPKMSDRVFKELQTHF